MRIQYIDNTNIAYYNGKKFHREGNKYYKRTEGKKQLYLHRYVYETEVGVIPDGYDIHHKDGNKANNDLNNLELLTKKEHRQAHMTEEEKEAKKRNVLENALPKAIEWHKSEQGRELHREIAKNQKREPKELICDFCGKKYNGFPRHENNFCSNNCKSAYRRKAGTDREERLCAICGKSFYTNKYSRAVCCSKSCSAKYRWLNKRHEVV